jgi:hypothetical protein
MVIVAPVEFGAEFLPFVGVARWVFLALQARRHFIAKALAQLADLAFSSSSDIALRAGPS